MQIQDEERALLIDIAEQLGVDVQALIAAVEHESPREVAEVLGIDETDARARLEPIRRMATIGDDWGAGCRLLSDEMRGELRRALRGLLDDRAHSASFGVSQG